MTGNNWTTYDPGAGSYADIRAAASARVADAETARAAGSALSVPSEGLVGATADALASQVEVVRTEILGIASQHEADAGALSVYAGEIERIRIAQRAIESEQRTVEATTHRLRADAERLRTQRRSWAAQDQEEKVWQLDHQLMVNSQQATFAATEAQRLDRRMDALAEERRIADVACVASLSGASSRGGLGSAYGTTSVLTSCATLSGLSQLSPLDILTLLEANPAALDNLTGAPEEVAPWWAGLTLEQQTAVVLAAPAFIGSLDGVPVMSRVAANRLVATEQLEKDRAYLASLSEDDIGVPGRPYETRPLPKEISEIQERIRYLERAISPDENGTYVQLVLFDVEGRRIIEMFGTPGPDTKVTLTHVPGTFTSMSSFYSGEAQELPAVLARRSENQAVTFAWKGGAFPGEGKDPSNPAQMIQGIVVEANDQGFADRIAPALAQFGRGMQLDPHLSSIAHDASGHSWGLNAVTTAETEGLAARNVYSLAGAYVAPDWDAPADNYYAVYYKGDQLSTFQDVMLATPNVPGARRPEDSIIWGPVGGGNVPQYQDEFKPLIEGVRIDIPDNTGRDGVALHNLVGSSDEDNERVYRAMLERMLGE